jgi:hypothetical protein
LAALGQIASLLDQPGETLGSLFDVEPGVGGVGARSGVGGGAAAQPPHHVPGCERLDQSPMLGDGDGGKQRVEPALGAGQLFVTGR